MSVYAVPIQSLRRFELKELCLSRGADKIENERAIDASYLQPLRTV